MSTQVFVNLPTSDLERSKTFFEALGWRIEPNFTDQNAACVVIDQAVYLMILTREFFATFTDKPIADPNTSLQVETALSAPSKEAVDELLAKVIAAGGKEYRPVQDMGFMYGRTFDDPDGNQFSMFWMDPAAAEQGPESFDAEQEENLGHS